MLSFIIPTFNEEKNILSTLTEIKKHVPNEIPYEIIVIDHGSADNTVSLANQLSDEILSQSGGTVAGLRNLGVKHSSGDILVFIDADVRLTSEWALNITQVIQQLDSNNKIVTGSWVSVPDNSSWIEKSWFQPLQKISNTHINSGHMIMSRELFNSLNGFNPILETGEDYDISMRAKELGAVIIDNHKLKVIHDGYPKTLPDFIKREYWHGKGDAISIFAVLKSKVAIIASAILASHISLISSLLLHETALTVISLTVITVLCLFSSVKKYSNESAQIILNNTFLYYFYFLARSASLSVLLKKQHFKKRER